MTSYEVFSFLLREAIGIDVMIQCGRSRLPTETALLDARKLDVQISKNPVVVPENSTGLKPVCESLRPIGIGGPDRCAQTIWCVVRSRNGFFFIRERKDRNQWSKLFASHDLVTFLGPKNDRRQHKKT